MLLNTIIKMFFNFCIFTAQFHKYVHDKGYNNIERDKKMFKNRKTFESIVLK